VTIARVVSLNVIPAVTFVLDKAFQIVIQRFSLYDSGVYDLYRSLKEGMLGVNVHFFSNALVTLVFFIVICLASLAVMRLWCRALCPLGAWYALNARSPFLKRHVDTCTACGRCVQRCRMGAIKQGTEYAPGECILCMDCVYDCPQKSTRFSFDHSVQKPADKKSLTRGEFLFIFASLFSFLGWKAKGAASLVGHPVIRPPASLPEKQFVNACVRCGNCMKVCPTNGLQPTVLESGAQGLWTPRLVPETGYCEHQCTLCGEVCPTQAIARVTAAQKVKTRLGTAVIDHRSCIAWDGNDECIVCEEHCPVPEKAIKTREEMVNGKKIYRPSVDTDLCVGCGICQNKCPVRPVRAIRVDPEKV
jgi:MauM/NapG family ferredoxin protein